MNLLQLAIFNKILLESLSVRDVEILIRQGHLKPENSENSEDKKNKKTTIETELSGVQAVFKEHLTDKLASKIEVSKTVNGAGKIIINFNSEVDFNRIIEILNK